MVPFVGVAELQELITSQRPDVFIRDLITYVEADFREWESFNKVPRVAHHTPFGVIELMPTGNSDLYGFKFVNGHPSNPQRGYQTVTAFGALATVHNGYPVLLAEMTLLTAFRTAAASALAAKYLAPKDSSTMAMIGSGSQAEFQAMGIRATTGIDRLRLFDVDPAAMAKARRNLEPLGFDVTLTRSARDAVSGAQVITTCTADKTNATVLHDDMVPDGVHINAIGGDCPGKTELDPVILDRADVFVEYEPQTRTEGEIQLKAPTFPVTELWRVIAGRAAGRSHPRQVTVFDSVGFAIEDFSALRDVHALVQGGGYDEIDLIASPDDPKDLFSLVRSPVTVG